MEWLVFLGLGATLVAGCKFVQGVRADAERRLQRKLATDLRGTQSLTDLRNLSVHESRLASQGH